MPPKSSAARAAADAELRSLIHGMRRAHLGDRAGFDADNLYRLLTRVAPGLIRVSADELTYPAHVMLRYRIERALISAEIEAEDIPALWDEGMNTSRAAVSPAQGRSRSTRRSRTSRT